MMRYKRLYQLNPSQEIYHHKSLQDSKICTARKYSQLGPRRSVAWTRTLFIHKRTAMKSLVDMRLNRPLRVGWWTQGLVKDKIQVKEKRWNLKHLCKQMPH